METEAIALDREDIILLILEANERLLRKKWFSGITRLEKLIFLLERETSFQGIGDFFVFEAHNYGPFSKEVYEALEFLSSCEFIEEREKAYPSPYSSSDEAKLMTEISENEVAAPSAFENQVSEKQFALTENGRKVARIMREAVERRRPSDISELDEIVMKHGARPLNQLIRYVYHQHPDMTVKSAHPEAANVRHLTN